MFPTSNYEAIFLPQPTDFTSGMLTEFMKPECCLCLAFNTLQPLNREGERNDSFTSSAKSTEAKGKAQMEFMNK